MDEMNGFTVFCLLYGNHPQLAARCVGSIAYKIDPTLCRSIRVGLNAVSPATRTIVRELLSEIVPLEVEVLVYDAGEHNRLKYPLMRKMFYDRKHPIVTPFTMWFDDDSCLAPETPASWWGKVHVEMQQADMLGKLYNYPLTPPQRAAIEQQPWYAGKQVPSKFLFATGGWWCARTKLVQRWDYPFPQLTHNGGDTLLGELMRQQGYNLRNYSAGVWINADADGQASKAVRRGESKKPLWYNWPHDDSDRSHHQFAIDPYDPRKTMIVERALKPVDRLGRLRRTPQVPGL